MKQKTKICEFKTHSHNTSDFCKLFFKLYYQINKNLQINQFCLNTQSMFFFSVNDVYFNFSVRIPVYFHNTRKILQKMHAYYLKFGLLQFQNAPTNTAGVQEAQSAGKNLRPISKNFLAEKLVFCATQVSLSFFKFNLLRNELVFVSYFFILFKLISI